jgi:hypothetical protein
MGTFSINIGLSTESTSYPVRDYLEDLLDSLHDNDEKFISPRYIRNAVLSLYSDSPFKETTASGSSIYYVGIDTLNEMDNDIKKPILIGKRAFSGTYSYSFDHDILGTSSFGPLTSNNDIIFYNTKKDNVSNDETKIFIISGTNIGIHPQAPYIQSQKVISTTETRSLDFVNIYTGDISIRSDYGTVSINNITYPEISVSSASASNNKVLYWDGTLNKLYWGDITYPTLNFIGVTGSPLNIYGTPVNINGYPIEFSDSRRMPLTINDMISGTTFSNKSIADILNMIIYPYLSPLCSISILPPYSSGYTEVGTYPTPVLNYTITKRTLPTLITGLSNMIPSFYSPITTAGQTIVSTNSNGVVISPIGTASTEFKITVNDGTQSASASTFLTGIYPYFYGFSNVTTMNTTGLGSLTKLVESKSDKSIELTGNGNLYFIYDYNYGTLSNIYDNYGNTASASFSHTSLTFSSPTGLWAGRNFHVYQYNNVSQLGPPSVYFQFKY